MAGNFLFPYRFRYIGWTLVLLHVPVAMMGRLAGMINIMDVQPGQGNVFTGEHLFFIGTTLLMSAGLFIVAFSRERLEDEQIRQIRLDALRWSIYVNYLVLITSFVFIADVGHILELNLWVPLLFFIVRFRWALWRLNHAMQSET